MKPNEIINHTLKKAYTTKADAERVIAHLLSKEIVVYAYKCYCERWHLSSKDKK